MLQQGPSGNREGGNREGLPPMSVMADACLPKTKDGQLFSCKVSKQLWHVFTCGYSTSTRTQSRDCFRCGIRV